MHSLKQKLHQYCLSQVQEKITHIQSALQAATDNAHNETKSSAGDKYETGRAMAHLETEKLGPQLQEAQKLLDRLHQMHPEKQLETAQTGALIQTDKSLFYLSIGLGKVNLDQQIVFIISPTAPIAQAILGKKKGDPFQFNGMEQNIEGIF